MARGRKRLAKSTGLAIAAALLVAVLALVLRIAAPNTQRNLSNIVFDSYQRAMPRVWSPDVPVRIVDIDEESLKRHGQWPWSRALLASLTETIAEAGAAAIAFDFLFAEPDRLSPEQILTTLADTPARQALAKAIELTEPNDVRFARAIAATPSILAIALRHAGDTTVPIKTGFAVAGDDPTPFLTQFGGASLPLAAFVEVAKGLGSINWAPDRDQVLRRVPLVVSVSGHSCRPSRPRRCGLRKAPRPSSCVPRTPAARPPSAPAPGSTPSRSAPSTSRPTAAGPSSSVTPRPSHAASFRPGRS